MILIGGALLKRIVDAAESAYPEEACGLLVGSRRADGSVVVSRVEASRNVAAGARDRRFEIEPALRFRLMRDLTGTGESIVGHYHSHPDHPPTPSPTDLERAYEPDLVWVITSVAGGQAIHTSAYLIERGRADHCRIVVEGSPGPVSVDRSARRD